MGLYSYLESNNAAFVVNDKTELISLIEGITETTSKEKIRNAIHLVKANHDLFKSQKLLLNIMRLASKKW